MRTMVRRQARGLARMESILTAAVAVFARVGVERATTNAIAAEAGISPGSLYQYYANKDEIVEAVAARYLAGLRTVYAEITDALTDPGLSLAGMVGRVVDPLVEFKASHAAFAAVLGRTPTAAQGELAGLHAAFGGSLIDLLARRNPDVPQATVQRCARECTTLFEAMLPRFGTTRPDPELEEFKRVLVAYLAAEGIR